MLSWPRRHSDRLSQAFTTATRQDPHWATALKFGPDLEVLEPAALRAALARASAQMMRLYEAR